MKKFGYVLCLFLWSASGSAYAQTAEVACAESDARCIMGQIEGIASKIEDDNWRDKAYRELAKTYAYDGQEEKALALLPLIKNPDTQALTIRGIGFAAADKKFEKERLDQLFEKLQAYAAVMTHAPSKGIALTYIAMAQAFAGDDMGATKTAKAMENDALRHKAFGETAEIQAERGDYDAAATSITHIESEAFRNKAFRVISKIFVQKGNIEDAYKAAQSITNPYQKAQALQLILNKGNPEEETGRDEE